MILHVMDISLHGRSFSVMSLLLCVFYLAFIGLGLPDSLLGAAWPSVYPFFGVPVSACGLVSFLITASTVVSSLLGGRLHRRLGTGPVVAGSTGLTALALWGFSLSRSYPMMCLMAVPYGLGAGCIDAVLNNEAALRYSARHMNWLHCMWGVGCSLGPVLMSRAIGRAGWQAGYRLVGLMQTGLTLLLLCTMGLWRRREETAPLSENRPSFRALLRRPGVWQAALRFLAYCGLESTAGLWAASYLTLWKRVPVEQAAFWAGLFYVGITGGRVGSGFLSQRLSDGRMIGIGLGLLLAGIALLLLPLPAWCALAGLVLCGLGCAPIYPSMLHETPRLFGQADSQSLMSLQMASAYVGSALMPPLLGLIAQKGSFGVYPVFLLALWLALGLNRRVAATKA